MLVPISEIKVNPGRRAVNPDDVQDLARSIQEVGLLNPITLDKEKTLIAGLHRLEAVKLLEWTEIECTISSLEGLMAELAEIDENVVRSDLSAVESGDLLLRRKEIYETLHPETKNGGDRKSEKIRTSKCRSDFESEKSFVQDTSEKLGVAKRTVERQIQTAKNLVPEAKDIIRDANIKIGKATALKLSRLSPEQQKEAASMLASGEVRSVEQYKTVKNAQTANRSETEEVLKKSDAVKLPADLCHENTGDPEDLGSAPYHLPDRHFSSFAESVADLKDPNKDCSCTADIFLAEFSGFVRKFTKEIQWYMTPHYEAVFPSLTQVQVDYLRTQVKSFCSAAEELLKKVERKQSA